MLLHSSVSPQAIFSHFQSRFFPQYQRQIDLYDHRFVSPDSDFHTSGIICFSCFFFFFLVQQMFLTFTCVFTFMDNLFILLPMVFIVYQYSIVQMYHSLSILSIDFFFFLHSSITKQEGTKSMVLVVIDTGLV